MSNDVCDLWWSQNYSKCYWSEAVSFTEIACLVHWSWFYTTAFLRFFLFELSRMKISVLFMSLFETTCLKCLQYRESWCLRFVYILSEYVKRIWIWNEIWKWIMRLHITSALHNECRQQCHSLFVLLRDWKHWAVFGILWVCECLWRCLDVWIVYFNGNCQVGIARKWTDYCKSQ